MTYSYTGAMIGIKRLKEVDRSLFKLQEALNRKMKMRLLGAIELDLEMKLRKAWVKQGALFLGKFVKTKDQFKESPADDTDRIWQAVEIESSLLLIQPINEAIGEAMSVGGKNMIAQIGSPDFSFNLKNPRALDYLVQHGAEMVTKINEATRLHIKRIVIDAMKKGWSYEKTARVITKSFAEFGVNKPQLHIRTRGELVAVTEAGNAYEYGAYEAAQQMKAVGIDTEKYWATVGDSRVSDGCSTNEGAGWIDSNDTFPSGHEHPLRFPGCRCSALWRRKHN